METYPWIFVGSPLILPRELVSDGVLEYTIHLAPFEIGVLEWDQSSGQHADGWIILCHNTSKYNLSNMLSTQSFSPCQNENIQTSRSPPNQG